MSDFFSLYENMRVWEYLDHFARCYGIDSGRRDRLIDEALELVSLEVRRDSEINELSRGMRQRLCFAKSLLHEPQVLLLDEPASGLDPAGRLEFRELLKQLHAMGRTILISSHILTEMTDFCTSIGIMEQGKLLKSGRVDDILREMQSGLRLKIEVQDGAERLHALLAGHPSVAAIVRQQRPRRVPVAQGRDGCRNSIASWSPPRCPWCRSPSSRRIWKTCTCESPAIVRRN